jgi:hypothetical protein
VVATLGNYVGDNICHSGTAAAAAGPTLAGTDVSCLRSYWQVLNATNAAAGGSSTLLTQQSWSDADIAKAVALVTDADQVRTHRGEDASR